MKKLPRGFPEYFIMYKTLSKQIRELEEIMGGYKNSEKNKDVSLKIKKYQSEVGRIKDKFPDGFFDELS